MFATGIVATMGIGMMLTALFFWTSSGKAGANPFLLFFARLFSTFDGGTFPVEALPGSLRAFSELITRHIT